jgi:hypothetical protein
VQLVLWLSANAWLVRAVAAALAPGRAAASQLLRQPVSVTLELLAAEVRMRAGERDDTVVRVHPSDPAKPEGVEAADRTRVEYTDGAATVQASTSYGDIVIRRSDPIPSADVGQILALPQRYCTNFEMRNCHG